MSKYKQFIVDRIKAEPGCIQPKQYRDEILARLKGDELRDLSISRCTFNWGIPCPPDEEQERHVMYVWFDALTNYMTGEK